MPSFFFNDTATTEIYTLSLHDALPICSYLDFGLGWTTSKFIAEADAQGDAAQLGSTIRAAALYQFVVGIAFVAVTVPAAGWISRDLLDRKSTRLNSSHANISYALFFF